MRFSYLDYSRDLLSSTIDNYPPRVYVFDNYKNRQQAEAIYEPPVLEKQSLFLTMSELKEKLYPPQRLVLKEEKLTVILYELMNDRQRSLLGIENYFDVIDLAGDFFHFYNELQEYKVKQEDKIQMMGHMRDWQREKFSIFQDLRRKYLDYLRDSGYTDKIMSLRQSGFDTHFFRDYREFVFINIVDFSPREQELLEKLEQ
ncbi:MAG: PD-(D/E)XK nuclease family protein, partial [Bacillota bacterium]